MSVGVLFAFCPLWFLVCVTSLWAGSTSSLSLVFFVCVVRVCTQTVRLSCVSSSRHETPGWPPVSTAPFGRQPASSVSACSVGSTWDLFGSMVGWQQGLNTVLCKGGSSGQHRCSAVLTGPVGASPCAKPGHPGDHSAFGYAPPLSGPTCQSTCE